MGNYYLHIEKKPSGRAKCLACRQPILKDQPALSVGNYYFHSHEYVHANCVALMVALAYNTNKPEPIEEGATP